jgi:hypothetical protein
MVQLWDPTTRRLILAEEAQGARQQDGLAFSPDETRLATASGREIKLRHLPTGQEIITLPLANLPDSGSVTIVALGWTSDGHSLRAA